DKIGAVALVEAIEENALQDSWHDIVQRAGLCVCQRCKFIERTDIERAAHDDDLRIVEEVHHRTERFSRVWQLPVEKLVRNESLIGQNADRVAIGRGLGAGAGADNRVASWPRLDDHALAPAAVQLFGKNARKNV